MIKSSNKAQLAEYGVVVVTIAFLLAAMYFIPPRLTGLAVIPPGASVVNLTPTAAIDNVYIDQVSPDGGSTDGTVDLSNNDARWLTNNGDNINVTAWNQAIPSSTINNVTAYCEVDFVNPKGGDISFGYNTGSGWSNWLCPVSTSSQTIYYCNLFKNGVDTLSEVNNLDLRCRMSNAQSGAIGFSIDSIKLEVVYTLTTTTSTSTSSSTSSSTSISTTTSTTSTSTSTSTSISTTSTSTSTSTSSTSTSTSTSSTSTSTTSTSTSTSTTSTSTSTSTTSTTTSSTSTSTSTSSTSTSTSSTSTSTSSSTTSSTSTSISTTSTSTSSSTSTSTSSSSTITSTSTSTTVEPETTVEGTSNNRRETTTIQPLETSTLTSTLPTIIQPVTTETTTIAQLPATTIAPTGQFALAGRAITDNIIQPIENRLLILISAILGLIYIYYKQTRKHFPHKAHINELKKNRKRSYY